MRSALRVPPEFLAGFAVGLALAGGTFLIIGARRRRRGRDTLPTTERAAFIDGVRPPNDAELHARPAAEANATYEPRLESEAPDVPAMSQRW